MKIQVTMTLVAEYEIDPEDFKDGEASTTPTTAEILTKIKDEAQDDPAAAMTENEFEVTAIAVVETP